MSNLSRFVIGVLIVIAAIMIAGLMFAANDVPWPSAEATGFIAAIAQLLGSVQWLLVVLAVALLFRKEIRNLIPRISATEFFGNKLTIAEEVRESANASALVERLSAFEQRFDRIEERVTVIDDRLGSIPDSSPRPSDSLEDSTGRRTTIPPDWFEPNPVRIREAIRLVREGHAFTRSPEDASDPVTLVQDRVLEAAATSPVDALFMLTDSIREVLYEIARSVGLDTGRRPAKVAEDLAARGILDQLIVDALKKYWTARAASYHGSRNDGVAFFNNEDFVLDTIDSGLVLLRVLGGQSKVLAAHA